MIPEGARWSDLGKKDFFFKLYLIFMYFHNIPLLYSTKTSKPIMQILDLPDLQDHRPSRDEGEEAESWWL